MALATRDLMTDLRSAGATTRGPPPLSRQDISRFLSALDLAVVRLKRKLAIVSGRARSAQKVGKNWVALRGARAAR